MAKLEVQIGADSSELKKEVEKAVVIIDKLDKKPPIVIKPKVETAELEKSTNKAKEKLSELAASTAQLEKVVISTKPPIVNLGKALDQLSVSTSKVADSNRTSTSTITTTGKHLSTLEKTTDKTGQAFANMQKPVANGGNTLMQFSRIAQDAPYGIMGIGNNITATVEAFGHLKNSTGSAGSALKAMAGSLLGSGGILLAVSLVTTALTYMSQNGITLGDVFNKLTGNFDGYASALKKVNEEAYKDDGVKSAIANVNELKINIDLAKKGFLDKNQVVKQYNETIGKTTGLVGNLDQAEKMLVRNGDAYIKMTLYKAAANLALEEAAKKTLEAEETRVKKLKDFASVTDDLSSATKMTTGTGDAPSVEDYKALKDQRAKAQKKRKDEEIKINQDAANKNISIAKKFQSQAAQIATEFNFNLFNDTKADKTKSSSSQESKRPKLSTVSALGGIDSDKLKAEGKKVIKVFEESLGSELNRFKETKIPLNIPLAPSFDQIKFDEMIGKLSEFDIAANEIIQGSISSTFQNLGNVIGEALSTGANVFQAFGQTLIQGLGNLISSLGDKLIQLGTAAVLAGTVVKLFGTISGVGAGLAAIAGGTLLKGMGSAIATKGGQQGGNSSGGRSVSTGSSVSSPTSSTGGGGGSSFQGGTVVFEISGQSLIGVLSNTLDKNRRLGGSLSF